MRDTLSERAVGIGLALLASAFVAALVHIASLLILPRVAPDDAFARLAAPLPPGTLRVLPGVASPASPVPFRDPLLATAICRYDLAAGPLRVLAPLANGSFVAVSFHTRTGKAFYALTDRAANEGRIDVVLVTEAQREQAEAADEDGEPARAIRVTAPETEGFVQFDVLSRVGGLEAADRELRSMSCEVERHV